MNRGIIVSRTRFGQEGVCYCILDGVTKREIRPFIVDARYRQTKFIHGSFPNFPFHGIVQPFNVVDYELMMHPDFKPRLTHPEDTLIAPQLTLANCIDVHQMKELISKDLAFDQLDHLFPNIKNAHGESWSTADNARNPRSVGYLKVTKALIQYGNRVIFTPRFSEKQISVPYLDASNVLRDFKGENFNAKFATFENPILRLSLSGPWMPQNQFEYRCYLQCSMILP